jgi:hypothetical protein
MRRSALAIILASLVLGAGAFLVSGATAAQLFAQAPLRPVGGSGVMGQVVLVQLPTSGTDITVVAQGLVPGERYVSLYYDNHTCQLEPYSADDVIGQFMGLPGGVGTVHGQVDDDLDEINSVSVRRASDFKLLACADVHPGG